MKLEGAGREGRHCISDKMKEFVGRIVTGKQNVTLWV